jgi:hypothetical protein
MESRLKENAEYSVEEIRAALEHEVDSMKILFQRARHGSRASKGNANTIGIVSV